MPVNQKKRDYAARLINLVQENNSVIIVHADNVGSKQMQQIRLALRGQAEMIMGKNTTMRRVLTDFIEENPEHPIKGLLPLIVGNIGMVFTNGDLAAVRDLIEENRVPAPARVGAIAPCDVFVEPGPTGCDPGQTSWFQALNIATKINRGQIEIISRVHLVGEGAKVGDSEAALLQKLDLRPFTYGLVVKYVFQDGEEIPAVRLGATTDDMIATFRQSVGALAAVCLEIGYPTKASITHSINYAFKALLSVGIGTDYKFDRVAAFEDFLANPGAFAAPAAGGAAAEEAAVEEEEEEEESAGGAGGLFGDDSDDDW